MQYVLTFLSYFEWFASNGAAAHQILTDTEAALADVAAHPPTFPAGATIWDKVQILATWGLSEEPLFAKVVNDIGAMITHQTAAIANAASGHRAMMSCCRP